MDLRIPLPVAEPRASPVRGLVGPVPSFVRLSNLRPLGTCAVDVVYATLQWVIVADAEGARERGVSLQRMANNNPETSGCAFWRPPVTMAMDSSVVHADWRTVVVAKA